MTIAVIADASALHMIPKLTSSGKIWRLLDEMTTCVERCDLCFPREVAVDLGVTARDEPVAGWSAGLGRALKPFRADIRYNRPLVAYAKASGYEEGFSTISGDEPSIAHVGRLACQFQAAGKDFVVATEDLGEGPLSPTMAQLCDQASWVRIGARETLAQLGLSAFLR